MLKPFRPAGIMLAVLAALACARPGADPAVGPAPDAPDTAELEAIYRARVDSSRMRFTDADVRFMTGMIAHHAQAIVMARLAPERHASPTILTLASRIINSQRDEIATMQQWLRDRGQPVPEIHVDGTTMTSHAGDHAMHMPGMLTADQMSALASSQGAEFDSLFLSSMIQHHRGAVTMVDELFQTDGAGQDEDVFKFASDVQVDQRTEIARMQLMLAELGPTGGASGRESSPGH